MPAGQRLAGFRRRQPGPGRVGRTRDAGRIEHRQRLAGAHGIAAIHPQRRHGARYLGAHFRGAVGLQRAGENDRIGDTGVARDREIAALQNQLGRVRQRRPGRRRRTR